MSAHILDRCLEALKAFAERAAHYDTDPHDKARLSDDFRVTVRLGDCRLAAEIRAEWCPPEVRRLEAGSAEGGPGPAWPDGGGCARGS